MSKNEIPHLPSKWKTIVLGDVITDLTPGFPCGDHNQEGKGTPHLRPMNISEKGEIDLQKVKYVEEDEEDYLRKGDVLFNNTNSPKLLGKTAHIASDRDWYFSNHMTRIRVDENVISPKWLAKYLHHLLHRGFYRQHCRNHVNQASINQTFLRENISVPLPPLVEQKRIVAKIEELFSKLNSGSGEMRDAKQRLELYNRGVLKAAMEGEFTEELRKNSSEDGADFLNNILDYRRDKWDDEFQEVFKYSGKDYEEPEEADPPENIHIPDEWTWGSINQISYVVGGLTKNKSKREDYDTEVPYLRVANVYANELDLEEIKSIKISEREKKTKMLQEGDLLVVEGNGSKSQIGRVAMWDGSISPCSHQNHLIKVRVLPEELRKFAVYWMLSPIGRKTIVDVASSTSGLHTLSITKVRSIPIPIPPVEEAKKIVEEIERRQTVADQILSDIENELNRSDRLRQSILKQAFEGKLIPQNPTADPGDELPKSKDGKPEQGEQLKLSEVKSNVE